MARPSSKDALRKMMEQKRAERAAREDLPPLPDFARISNTGQITCKLCNTLVKSRALWDVHCQTKQHKEAAAVQLTTNKRKLETSPTKQPTVDVELSEPPLKKPRTMPIVEPTPRAVGLVEYEAKSATTASSAQSQPPSIPPSAGVTPEEWQKFQQEIAQITQSSADKKQEQPQPAQPAIPSLMNLTDEEEDQNDNAGEPELDEILEQHMQRGLEEYLMQVKQKSEELKKHREAAPRPPPAPPKEPVGDMDRADEESDDDEDLILDWRAKAL